MFFKLLLEGAKEAGCWFRRQQAYSREMVLRLKKSFFFLTIWVSTQKHCTTDSAAGDEELILYLII